MAMAPKIAFDAARVLVRHKFLKVKKANSALVAAVNIIINYEVRPHLQELKTEIKGLKKRVKDLEEER